jgi:hypothetical protein
MEEEWHVGIDQVGHTEQLTLRRGPDIEKENMIGCSSHDVVGIEREEMTSEPALLGRRHIKIAPSVRVGWQRRGHSQDDRQRAEQSSSTLTRKSGSSLDERVTNMRASAIPYSNGGIRFILLAVIWQLPKWCIRFCMRSPFAPGHPTICA